MNQTLQKKNNLRVRDQFFSSYNSAPCPFVCKYQESHQGRRDLAEELTTLTLSWMPLAPSGPSHSPLKSRCSLSTALHTRYKRKYNSGPCLTNMWTHAVNCSDSFRRMIGLISSFVFHSFIFH